MTTHYPADKTTHDIQTIRAAGFRAVQQHLALLIDAEGRDAS